MYGRFVARGPWAYSATSRSTLWVMKVAAGRVAITARSTGATVDAQTGDYVAIRDEDEFVLASHPLGRSGPCPAANTPVVRGVARHGQDGPLTDLRAMTISATNLPMPAVLRLVAGTDTNAALDATFGLLEHERDRDDPDAARVTSRLADVLAAHARRAVAATTGLPPLLDHPRLGRAARAMHDDLARPWTVATLAREVHLSRAGFAAAFHEETGESPLAMLRRWRLREAKRLLRETTLSLMEIALRVGYESAPALSRAFTRQEKVAPGQWRRSPST
jgi:AraC-like DNA-binding protein